MQCPLSDAELISHTTHGENNLTVSYSTCPTCHGHWMSSFAANFIKLSPDERIGAKLIHPPGVNLKCPVCQQTLIRAAGDNTPDTVLVYRCPDHHGYFFPSGQLAAFKNAQLTKIAYHKLWNLPLPSVASVLLAGFLFLIVGGGLVTTLVALQNKQTATSQARQILVSHHAYVVPEERSVLVSAETSAAANLMLSVPTLHAYSAEMTAKGNFLYTTTLTNVPPGTYTYHYIFTVNGKTVTSEPYAFTMPRQ